MASAPNLAVVGKSLPKNDGPEKVSGEAKFVDDLGLQGMLYGAAVRSPHPHCRILSLDTSRAEALPGVHAVVTREDIPGRNNIPLVFEDHPILAEGVTRFQGEAIALVAAETPEIAKKAAGLVELEVEELPFVDDIEEALASQDVLVYGSDNCFRDFVIEKGDLAKGFEDADVVVEATYTVGYQCHGYLETQGMIAIPESQGRMQIQGSLQCPYYIHDAIAMGLGIPKNKVRVVQCPTGGGFGGKEDVPSVVAAHAALLAHKTQRPVKIIYSREEDFQTMSKRHPGKATIKYGAKADGTMVACEVDYKIDGGAYSTLSPAVLFRGVVHAAGPYEIPNVTIRGWAVATNSVPCGAYRGFGQPQIAFGQESLVDELAAALEMDPVELRLKNALVPGGTTATGQKVDESCGLIEAIEKVRQESGYDAIKAEAPAQGSKRRGIGVSASAYGVCLGAAGSYLDRAGSHVQITNDGSVLVAIGNTEVGQGARTVIAQIAAETLGCSYESIFLLDTDTTRVPDSGPTVASRTTVMSGNAVMDACSMLHRTMTEVAAKKLGVDRDKVTLHGGEAKAGEGSLAWEELVSLCFQEKVRMAEQGWYVSPPTSFDDKGQGDAYVCYTYSANAVELEVDVETGEIQLLWATSAHDIGKAINPQQAHGQIQGGNLQGLGYAIYEDMPRIQGQLRNTSFAGYILPTAADAPKYRSILIEREYPEGPYGAKGLGEPPLIGMAPAVNNALRHALGVQMDRTPMKPEDVWAKIQAHAQKGDS